MKPWHIVASLAAVALLVASRRAAREPGDTSSASLRDALSADWLAGLTSSDSGEAGTASALDTWVEDLQSSEAVGSIMATINRITGTPAAGMSVSQAGVDHIAQFEGLSLVRYRLGDGGWTIGRGRYYPDGGPVPPERITREQADAWFAEDLEARGAKWVRAYVRVPLTQSQFDALVSMAYNLSPKAFKTIADAVNAGQDPEAQAMRYTRPGTNLERGLRRRRFAELNLYRAEGIAQA